MITHGLEKEVFKALSIKVLIIISTSLITYKIKNGGLWVIIVNLLQSLQLPNVVVTVPAAGALL